MRQTGREKNIRSLIGFELFLKTACLSFFMPLAGRLFEFCLWASGYSYVTKENMVKFFTAPCTIACVVLVVFMGIAFLYVEAVTVSYAVRAGFLGQKLGVAELFFGGVTEAARLLQKGKRNGIKCWGEEWPAFLFGLIQRGVILLTMEIVLYGAGVIVLILCVTETTEPAGAVLLRIYRRYRMLTGVLFFSLNTVVFEFFCVELWVKKRKSGLPGEQREKEERTVWKTWKEKQRKVLGFRVACVLVAATAMIQTVTFLRNGSVLMSEALEELCITAHRGASGEAPENTLAAIELAVNQGADYVEIDIRLTADGVPVLLHDRALFRTTGVLKDVNEVTYEELVLYDAGARYAKEFAGQKVPSLREVFEKYGGAIGFNIELKTKQDKVLAYAVVELVEEYGLEESCIITSMSYQQLQWVKEYNEELKTGYIMSAVYGNFYENEAADFFSIRSDYVTEQVVVQAHSRGKEIHVWTVNKENEIKRMKAIGVDNIITNVPAYARETVQKDEVSETLEEWLLLLTSKK